MVENRTAPNGGDGKGAWETMLNDAVRLHQSGQLEAADQIYREVLTQKPLQADAWNLRGLVAYQRSRFSEALPFFNEAVRLRPHVAYYLGNLALAKQASGDMPGAEAAYLGALKRQSTNSDVLNNLGTLYEAVGRFDEAESTYLRALAERPGSVDAFYNLGHVRFQQRKLEAAIEAYESGLRLDPNSAKLHWNLALARLMSGDWDRGFDGYEYRWQGAPDAINTRLLDGPCWQGESLTDKTLVVYREQGLGDTIQFCRYLPWVAALAKKVILVCDEPLFRLLSFSYGHLLEVRSERQGLRRSEYDFHCPLLSLPRALRRDGAVFLPKDIPYLVVPAAMQRHYEKLFGPRERPRVGLVWGGKRDNRNDLTRSIPCERFLPLLQNKNIQWVSLQKERSAGDEELFLSQGGFDPMGQVSDFLDTAALTSCLDLVISVDTSVAHLAGALGKPVWLLNRYESEWRWQSGKTETPWYPSMRLFNQTIRGDWDGVIQTVGQRLENAVTQR